MMMENLWINQTSQPSSSSYTIMVISNWIEKFQNPPWKYSFMMVAGWSNRQTIQIKQTNDPDRKGQGRSFSFVRASSSKKNDWILFPKISEKRSNHSFHDDDDDDD